MTEALSGLEPSASSALSVHRGLVPPLRRRELLVRGAGAWAATTRGPRLAAQGHGRGPLQAPRAGRRALRGQLRLSGARLHELSRRALSLRPGFHQVRPAGGHGPQVLRPADAQGPLRELQPQLRGRRPRRLLRGRLRGVRPDPMQLQRRGLPRRARRLRRQLRRSRRLLRFPCADFGWKRCGNECADPAVHRCCGGRLYRISDLPPGEWRCCGPANRRRLVNVSESEKSRGRCGHRCARDEFCFEGRCRRSCPRGLKKCGNTCADRTSDPGNCGGCGVKCSGTVRYRGVLQRQLLRHQRRHVLPRGVHERRPQQRELRRLRKRVQTGRVLPVRRLHLPVGTDLRLTPSASGRRPRPTRAGARPSRTRRRSGARRGGGRAERASRRARCRSGALGRRGGRLGRCARLPMGPCIAHGTTCSSRQNAAARSPAGS